MRSCPLIGYERSICLFMFLYIYDHTSHLKWTYHIMISIYMYMLCCCCCLFVDLIYAYSCCDPHHIYQISLHIYIFGIKMQSELVRVSICSEDNRLCQLIRYADYPAHRSHHHHQRCLKVRGIRISLRDALNMCG